MSLQVWLPLNGNLNNYGVANVSVSNSGATVNSSGKIGLCYSFGNGEASSKGISLNNNFLSMSSECTISIWVNPAGSHYHYNGTFISSGNWNRSCWSFGLSLDNTLVDVLSGGYNTYVSCAVPTNTWTHLCCVMSGGTTRLYKNGIYVTSRSSSALKSDANNTFIGRETYADGYFTFNGKLNDLRIYDECLSDEQIREISKGLVLHYPLSDSYIESTTNIAPSPISLSYPPLSPGWDTALHPNAVSVSNWGGGYNSGVSDPTHGYHAMWNIIDGIPTIIYQNHNSIISLTGRWMGISSYELLLRIPAGTKYTISYEQRTIDTLGGSTRSGVYYKRTSADGNSFWDGCDTIGRNTKLNTWEKFSKTYTRDATSDTTGTIGTIYIYGMYGTESTMLVRNILLEIKDHATGYTPASRVGKLYDTSGYQRHGTPSGSFSILSTLSSPRNGKCINFIDSDGSILIPDLSTILTDTTFTFNIWFRKNTDQWSSKGYETILGGTSGFEVEAKNSSNNVPKIVAYNWGGGTIDYTLDTWHMLTFVRTANDSKFYLDGVLGITGTTGTIPSSSYFIGAWNTATQQNFRGYMSDARIYATALSAEDIQHLYNAPISVTNTGGLMTLGEVIEE